MSYFREKVKSETLSLHQKVENCYPFNALLKSENIETNASLALMCFKLQFFNFLYEKMNTHEFYLKNFQLFSQLHIDFNSQLISPNFTEKSLLSFEYVFLGSRIGNQILIKKNPSITNTTHGEIFALSLPESLWTSTIESINEITKPDKQLIFINEVKNCYQNLIDYAKLICSDV